MAEGKEQGNANREGVVDDLSQAVAPAAPANDVDDAKCEAEDEKRLVDAFHDVPRSAELEIFPGK